MYTNLNVPNDIPILYIPWQFPMYFPRGFSKNARHRCVQAPGGAGLRPAEPSPNAAELRRCYGTAALPQRQ